MAEKTAYCQAAQTGMYERPTGLLGKYDNVRRFWEDWMTAAFMAPAITDLVGRTKRRGQGIRILDLGCGSGDGFELLTGVPSTSAGIADVSFVALEPHTIGHYVGLDINEDLLRQARECHGRNPRTHFVEADRTNGLPPEIQDEEPFDLYFAGYGTLTHVHDAQASAIIADICGHAPDGALFVGDWLGRYSYEWQDLWHHPVDREYFMDYRISYIYEEDERDRVEVASFPLRLMTRDEIMAVIRGAEVRSGASLKPLTFFDRSILVGRHTETGDYNRHCPRIRNTVNSLLEHSRRTDLSCMLVDYVPRQGFDELNHFFENFFGSCNMLVKYTMQLLERYDPDSGGFDGHVAMPDACPLVVKDTMEIMENLILGVGRLNWSDPRSNLIEPTLGYCLRKLEMDLQPGSGVGHGLIGVFEIRK
ncbi:MAG: class I SAM-dependent methyltransferase [Deltaproteobacteria bacterium]